MALFKKYLLIYYKTYKMLTINHNNIEIDEEILQMSCEDLEMRIKLLDNEMNILKSELNNSKYDLQVKVDEIDATKKDIELNKVPPFLVASVVEVLDMDADEDNDDNGANTNVESQRKGKCAVIKTSTRQTIFLPNTGLLEPEQLKPGQLVSVNKDSFLLVECLPSEIDARVKAMEVDEKPTEQYSDIGGLDKQIQELIEAVVLPVKHKEQFKSIGIQPHKGIIMYGPPGTGKT